MGQHAAVSVLPVYAVALNARFAWLEAGCPPAYRSATRRVIDTPRGHALHSRFIQVRNRSTYPAQEKSPKGEVHEDIGYFSHDSGRKRIVFRQFHTEGFVNQYVWDPASKAERIVLVEHQAAREDVKLMTGGG